MLVLASTAFAAPAAAAKGPLPFKGSIQPVETTDFQPPTLYIDATGSGNATHLGRYAVTYEVLVDDSTGEGIASLAFIAANGDSIFADGLGKGNPSGIPGVNKIVEEYTIAGGTGRFAGATGSFTVERLVNLGTGASSGSFVGKIAIP